MGKAMTRAAIAALVAAAAAFAGAEVAMAATGAVPPDQRLTILKVFGHATVPVQVILGLLLLATLASLAIWAMQLTARTPAPGRLAFLAGVTAASPLLGLAAAAYSLLNSCIGIANVRPTPDLATLAPGLAEALTSVLLALLASAIALIAKRHLEGRSGGVGARAPMTKGATALG